MKINRTMRIKTHVILFATLLAILILLVDNLLLWRKFSSLVKSGEMIIANGGFAIPEFIPAFFSLALIFMAGAGFFLNSQIQKLIRAIEKVSHGDFSAEIKFKESEIFCDVFSNFNLMARELQSNQILKEDFVNNFSHELKTPINSILGFSKLLLEKGVNASDERLFLEIIRDESERLSLLSKNALLLSRLESDQIVTDKTSFRIDEQIRQCAILLEKKWEEKNLALELNIESANFFGNKNLVEEIWLNLLDNAIKFSPQNETIFVELKKSSTSSNSQNEKIIVKIRNSGEPISEEEQKRIFEKFFKGKTQTHQGNGLGLSIVKRISELCGGKISVKSDATSGTEFCVELPS